MVRIPVGDTYALVNDDLHQDLARSNWYLNANGYAIRRVWNDAEHRYDDEFMHRIVNATPSGAMIRTCGWSLGRVT